jgi:hypothetical protein
MLINSMVISPTWELMVVLSVSDNKETGVNYDECGCYLAHSQTPSSYVFSWKS